jgi:hypothetical protein
VATVSTVERSPPKYAAAELENSAPFDPDRRLRGEAGAALLDDVRDRIEAWESRTGSRKRVRKPDDAASFALTLDTLLANLIALWLNRVDATRFLAVAFDSNAYRKLPLSLRAMTTARVALEALGLIEVAPGFLKWNLYEIGKPFARRTRIRAKPELIETFELHGIGHPSIQSVGERDVISIRKKADDAGDEPPEVVASAAVLKATNARLKAADVTLPNEAWKRIKGEWEDGDDVDAYRAHSGDDKAKVLHRIFSERWERGGRIYGGWWMHVPKEERQHILIDGEHVTEWDFGRLHPSLLYRRESLVLDFDPYCVPGVEGPGIRELGKKTFQRLINRKDPTPMRAARGNLSMLPRGMSFAEYLALYTARLGPVARWFNTGVGMSLQREDSDLAITILGSMEAQGIVTLPVHDSFIVQERHGETLKKEMVRAYRARYGVEPYLKGSEEEAAPENGGKSGVLPPP